jgi:4-coumarate--CoA ligase
MTTTLAMVSASQKQGPLGSKSNRYHLNSSPFKLASGGGRLLPGIQAQVIKPDGSPAIFGERGELVVKGPGKALGYFGNLQA